MHGYSEKTQRKLSKFLSLVLRHQPELIGITLDEAGWTDIEILIKKARAHGVFVDRGLLQQVVKTNTKKRFALHPHQDWIRANQGHSVPVVLGYEPQEPPETLYHGSIQKVRKQILKEGLQKQKRHHVHLSLDRATATEVGKRHGKLFLLEVAAQKMFTDGHVFYQSENGVWLTESVPVEYLTPLDSPR